MAICDSLPFAFNFDRVGQSILAQQFNRHAVVVQDVAAYIFMYVRICDDLATTLTPESAYNSVMLRPGYKTVHRWSWSTVSGSSMTCINEICVDVG